MIRLENRSAIAHQVCLHPLTGDCATFGCSGEREGVDVVRPPYRWMGPLALLIMLTGCKVWRPSNDRIWSPDQAVLPYAEIDGNLVTVHNIRNCKYRSETDYTVDHYDRTFDLNELETVDFIVVPFAEAPQLAHTMLSFGFAGRDYLACSVEIRKELGETYSPIMGMLRQYELMYVLGDERDLVLLRTNHRLSEVYLYRSRATPQQARDLFLDVLARVNKLYEEPEFYNALTNNCTTNIVQHVNRLAPGRVPYALPVLLPGYSDRYAYDLGLLDTDTSFEETRARAKINMVAYLYRDDPNFSVRIREYLQGRENPVLARSLRLPPQR